MKSDPLPLDHVSIEGGYWESRQRVAREVILPYQWKVLNDRVKDAAKSCAIKNFKIAAGRAKGDFHGYVFQDSDVGKWLEAVAYRLATHPDKKLEKIADSVIELMAETQDEDGYIDTCFTIKDRDQRWTNLRDNHEMYVMGHLLEGAIAYFEATGKRKFLDVMAKGADLLVKKFGPKRGQIKGYPGHQEIELALVKLYRVTGEKKYLDLAKHFLDERGKKPLFFLKEAKIRGEKRRRWGDWNDPYRQAHKPIRDQKVADGHAVRFAYMTTGMADVARETGDRSLLKACKTLWDNVVEKQMYVTGGIGAKHGSEAFTYDYDLPNETAYAETCAAIAMVFWAQRMVNLDDDGQYADIMELALYNSVMSGVSIEGEHYFYVNPLAVYPDDIQSNHYLRAERFRWHGCACCPPNLARLLTSLGSYIYSLSKKTAFVHLFVNGSAKMQVGGTNVEIVQKTEYPWREKVRLTVHPESPAEFTLAVRMPAWCRKPKLQVNGKTVRLEEVVGKGYARISREWRKGDRIDLDLPMPVERIYCNPRVRMNDGRVALKRGPIVYCLEQVDNGPDLNAVVLPANAKLSVKNEKSLLDGVPAIVGKGKKADVAEWGESLYRTEPVRMVDQNLKAIPYSLWANRGKGEMLVWIREE